MPQKLVLEIPCDIELALPQTGYSGRVEDCENAPWSMHPVPYL
jgi:hypothetical protein